MTATCTCPTEYLVVGDSEGGMYCVRCEPEVTGLLATSSDAQAQGHEAGNLSEEAR